MTDEPLESEYDDGGRKAAGFEGDAANDCLVRAIAIATREPLEAPFTGHEAASKYSEIYDIVKHFGASRGDYPDAAHNGLPEYLCHQLLTNGEHFSWQCMELDNAHLTRKELPDAPVFIASSEGHWCAVIARVIRDTVIPTFVGSVRRVIKGVYLPP
jgi:hypothetical protein